MFLENQPGWKIFCIEGSVTEQLIMTHVDVIHLWCVCGGMEHAGYVWRKSTAKDSSFGKASEASDSRGAMRAGQDSWNRLYCILDVQASSTVTMICLVYFGFEAERQKSTSAWPFFFYQDHWNNKYPSSGKRVYWNKEHISVRITVTEHRSVQKQDNGPTKTLFMQLAPLFVGSWSKLKLHNIWKLYT